MAYVNFIIKLLLVCIAFVLGILLIPIGVFNRWIYHPIRHRITKKSLYMFADHPTFWFPRLKWFLTREQAIDYKKYHAFKEMRRLFPNRELTIDEL